MKSYAIHQKIIKITGASWNIGDREEKSCKWHCWAHWSTLYWKACYGSLFRLNVCPDAMFQPYNEASWISIHHILFIPNCHVSVNKTLYKLRNYTLNSCMCKFLISSKRLMFVFIVQFLVRKWKLQLHIIIPVTNMALLITSLPLSKVWTRSQIFPLI